MTATKDELLKYLWMLYKDACELLRLKHKESMPLVNTEKYLEAHSIIEQHYSLTEYERKAALKYVNDNLRVNGGGE